MDETRNSFSYIMHYDLERNQLSEKKKLKRYPASDDSEKQIHAGSLTALLLVIDGGLGNCKNIHE